MLDELAVEDRVFSVPEKFCPPKEEIPKALGRIYDARSGNLHKAVPFPGYVGIGTKTTISISQLLPMFSQQVEIPPVVWFERIVSLAARRFLLEKSAVKSTPFRDA